jgi:hypothetical protein
MVNCLPFLCCFFLLCFNIAAQSVNNNCTDAIVLCDTSQIHVLNTPQSSIGDLLWQDEDNPDNIIYSSNSAWFKWTIKSQGELAFFILPFQLDDDFDFVLYQLVESINTCDNKLPLRTMFAGPELGGEIPISISHCAGVTGIFGTSLGHEAFAGCKGKNDNFLQSVWAEAGTHYALLVHNFRSNGGFSLIFNGGVTFANNPDYCQSISANPGININEQNFKVHNLYPNPATQELIIPVESTHNIQGFGKVIDITGIVHSEHVLSISQGKSNLSIQIDHLPIGVYWISIVVDKMGV